MRKNDVRASFSSHGPTRGDYLAKPDLLAPGYGILSLAVPGSTLYNANQPFLVLGSLKTAFAPYLSLSGTSMAAPQVAGAVALMFQANPNLTPNLVKGILQYTAQSYPQYNALEQGAGFLDVLSAVRLARFYAKNRAGAQMPVRPSWSKHLIWGSHMISGGYLNPKANAWAVSTVWGADAARRRRQHRLGHVVRRLRRRHRVGHARRHRRQHRVGDQHRLGHGRSGDDNIVWGNATSSGARRSAAMTTSSGAPTAAAPTAATSSGAPTATTTSSGAPPAATTTSSGARTATTTSCGAPTVTTTSCGARRATTTSSGAPQGDDNIVWGTAGRRQHRVGHERRRQHRVGHPQRRRYRSVGPQRNLQPPDDEVVVVSHGTHH